jgi:hypothetical protein
MGRCHIITVYEDGIEYMGKPRYELSEQLGRVTMDLCVSPQFEWTDSGTSRVTDSRVGRMGNCVTWVDEVHSTEEEVFVWTGNCLRRFDKLSESEREAVMKRLANSSSP